MKTAVKNNVLIIEDEIKVATFIKKGLETQNFAPEVAYTAKEALELFTKKEYAIIILDIGLPDMSGLAVCERIRRQSTKVPILMLTAMGTVADKLSGFEVGTDDYLVKPFDFMELLVRINALIKRSGNTSKKEEFIVVGDLELDLKEKVARRAGNVIPLTAKEYILLEYLMLNSGRVMSKVDIAENVWDINFDTGTNFVEVYINYLRKKIDKDYPEKLIHTMIGMGYVMKIK